MLKYIAGTAVILVGLSSASVAQDALLGELYGQGVHAFFAGQLQESEKLLETAISEGSEDPRAYYYLGLVKHSLGDEEAAKTHIAKGAELEANGGGTIPVGRSLERIQGSVRLEIENQRQLAKLKAHTDARKNQRNLFENRERNEENVLRQPMAQPGPGDLEGSDLEPPAEGPFAGDGPAIGAGNPDVAAPMEGAGEPDPFDPAPGGSGEPDPFSVPVEPSRPAGGTPEVDPFNPGGAPADPDPAVEAPEVDPFNPGGAPADPEPAVEAPEVNPFGDPLDEPAPAEEPVDPFNEGAAPAVEAPEGGAANPPAAGGGGDGTVFGSIFRAFGKGIAGDGEEGAAPAGAAPAGDDLNPFGDDPVEVKPAPGEAGNPFGDDEMEEEPAQPAPGEAVDPFADDPF